MAALGFDALSGQSISGSPGAAAAPATVSEDDSFWANSQFGFTRVPVTIVAAALSVAVSIGSGFNWANDDLPVTPAAAVEKDEDYWQQSLPSPSPLPQRLSWVDDDLPTPAATISLDDGDWQVTAAKTPAPVVAVWTVPDERPFETVYEDDRWQYPQRIPAPVQISGAVWFIDDEPPAQVIVAQLDDGDWNIPPAKIPAALISGPVWDDQVPVRPVDKDEDYWWRSWSIPARAYALELYQDDATPSTAPPIVDEDYNWTAAWIQQPIVRLGSPVIQALPVNDDLPSQVVVSVFEDDSWLANKPVAVQAKAIALYDSGEIVIATTLDESVWQQPYVVPVLPAFLPTRSNEDHPFQAAFADDAWQVYTPLPPPLRFVFLPDPEVIPAGSLSPAVFGWGARNRIGGTPAQDPWQRIGTEMATEPPAIVGTQTAIDPWQRIGTETAIDELKRIGSEAAVATPGKIGGDDTQ